jgi:short-subunit dehydrogenase
MERMDLRSRWALVTGASSGLGLEIARQLAARGANLVLVARREAKLLELKQELEARHSGCSIAVLPADLSRTADAERVFQESTVGREIHAVILNAGVTHFGDHDELPWSEFEAMLAINVSSVVRLSTLFVPYLAAANRGGGLLIISSMAAIVPVPYQSAYTGTKAFLRMYGGALHHEAIVKNVSVTTFLPGGIVTEMTAGERFGPLRGWLMPVDRCAQLAIEAMIERRYRSVPGLVNWLGSVVAGLLPERFFTARVAATYRNALRATVPSRPR